MFAGNFDNVMFLAILPEILLLVLGVFVLGYDLFTGKNNKGGLGWLTAGGLVLTMVICLFAAIPGAQSLSLWGGMLRFDRFGFIFQMLFLFGAAITCLFAMNMENLGKRGEFYLLLVIATLGMSLMASAGDLIMLYLAIETTSIPLYVLAGFLTKDEKSTESGFKYLLFGALTSTIMLYGFSLIFGFTNTTNLVEIARVIGDGKVSLAPLVGAMILVMVGFSFKISAIPFHFWAPDVYEGAPTPVAGFLSTASKAAGFSVLLRVLITAFPGTPQDTWVMLMWITSIATMTVGNVLALAQKNIKRLLAYSSIAHAGYALIGMAAVSSLGLTSVIFYLTAYLITNLAAFGVVYIFGRVVGSDEISAYAGLSRRAPGLALAMLIAFLSLAGMPPLGGFMGKFFVFASAVKSNMIWLAVVGVLNSIVGLYYYLTVLKVVYLYRSEDEEKPIAITKPNAIALVVLVIGIILVGTLFAPWFNISSQAALSLF